MSNINQNLTRNFGRVAVLYGGESAEREISLLSGNAVFEALLQEGVDAVKIDTKENLLDKLKAEKVERAFIVLHGRDGEDGVVQGFLKFLNIPYTGSDTQSSALAMNKGHSKNIIQSVGVNTASFSLVEKDKKYCLSDAIKIIATLNLPLFVKPVREGSSVGMSKVESATALVSAVELAQKYDSVMIEQYIPGREYTVTILNGEALPSISMVTPNSFYDYDAKYQSDETEYFCPSGLNEVDEHEVQQLALRSFKALGCSGWGRVDFIRDEASQNFMLLEVNTVPGMTKTSLVPKSAKSYGISFKKLVIEILKTSLSSKVSSEKVSDV
ncbi:MAG: D-alanine--D-alanine ligase [Gammaproteobacteria bacterium]|nr:MAG: D-alanine--D-alanine ligase [Gammaproteobacteria bacterium]